MRLGDQDRVWLSGSALPLGMVTQSERPVVVNIDGISVRVTNPSKVFFSKRGETKLDLVNYYLAVQEPLMRAIRGRPVLMQRYPDGVKGKSFFQKRVPKGAPDWLQTVVTSTPNGTISNALVAADVAHIVWAVNMGCLGFHTWPTKADDTAHTDELRIDLDPQPGTGFDDVRETAYEVKTALDEVGIMSIPKTSGSKGIHIHVPLKPRWDAMAVRYGAVALAREMQHRRPDLITCEWWKEDRGERVFVDFNQNAPHKTVFGAWSVRARVAAVVSTPITWDEVATVEPDRLTIASVPAKVAAEGDPWAGLVPQSLTPLLKWHERDMAAGLGDAPWPPQYPKMPNEPPRVSRSRRCAEG